MDKEAAIRELMPAAKAIASYYRRITNDTADTQEIYCIAIHAAYLALDRFDESRGYKLETFMRRRMMGAVQDYFRSLSGRKNRRVLLSLDGYIRDWDTDDPLFANETAIMACEDDHVAIDNCIELAKYIQAAGLSARELSILREYYCDGETMKDIGKHHGNVNESRACQLHKQALKKLRKAAGLNV